ncbi:MAG: hypothetical protein QW334_01640 [Thermofilum sp.]
MDVLDRPPVYLRDGKPVYRASATGYCLRLLTAARQGYEPLEKDRMLELAAREGRRHEEWIIEDLEEQGWRITDRGKSVVLHFPAFDIEGHIDGIARWGEREYLLEVKSMSRFQFRAFLRQGFSSFPEYTSQIATYHRVIDLPILFAVKCRDTGEIRSIELEVPPRPFSWVYDRLLTCELLSRKGRLAGPECDGGYRLASCRYRYLCERG